MAGRDLEARWRRWILTKVKITTMAFSTGRRRAPWVRLVVRWRAEGALVEGRSGACRGMPRCGNLVSHEHADQVQRIPPCAMMLRLGSGG